MAILILKQRILINIAPDLCEPGSTFPLPNFYPQHTAPRALKLAKIVRGARRRNHTPPSPQRRAPLPNGRRRPRAPRRLQRPRAAQA